eukprot:2059676-Alexandrium_andersonii.AAC.1
MPGSALRSAGVAAARRRGRSSLPCAGAARGLAPPSPAPAASGTRSGGALRVAARPCPWRGSFASCLYCVN